MWHSPMAQKGRDGRQPSSLLQGGRRVATRLLFLPFQRAIWKMGSPHAVSRPMARSIDVNGWLELRHSAGLRATMTSITSMPRTDWTQVSMNTRTRDTGIHCVYTRISRTYEAMTVCKILKCSVHMDTFCRPCTHTHGQTQPAEVPPGEASFPSGSPVGPHGTAANRNRERGCGV